jgi:hypothetical protein
MEKGNGAGGKQSKPPPKRGGVMKSLMKFFCFCVAAPVEG